MKLKILISIAAMAVLASCGPSYRVTDDPTTTTTTVIEVPTGIRTSFTTQYPTAADIVWTSYDKVVVPIDWEMTGWPVMDAGDYVVRFNMDNDKYYAWYDSDGNWIGTAYVINDYKTLPAAVSNTLTTQFADYTVAMVNKVMQKDRLAYEIEMKNTTGKVKLLVDENGKIIKQKVKTE